MEKIKLELLQITEPIHKQSVTGQVQDITHHNKLYTKLHLMKYFLLCLAMTSLPVICVYILCVYYVRTYTNYAYDNFGLFFCPAFFFCFALDSQSPVLEEEVGVAEEVHCVLPVFSHQGELV